MEKVSQTKAVLNYMQTHDGITSMEAFEKYGATRLSGLIFSLKKQGYNIVTEMVECTNRFGNTCHYAKYSPAEK